MRFKYAGAIVLAELPRELIGAGIRTKRMTRLQAGSTHVIRVCMSSMCDCDGCMYTAMVNHPTFQEPVRQMVDAYRELLSNECRQSNGDHQGILRDGEEIALSHCLMGRDLHGLERVCEQLVSETKEGRNMAMIGVPCMCRAHAWLKLRCRNEFGNQVRCLTELYQHLHTEQGPDDHELSRIRLPRMYETLKAESTYALLLADSKRSVLALCANTRARPD